MTADVYILASHTGVALYIGSTIDLRGRLEQHVSGEASGHASRYRIVRLV